MRRARSAAIGGTLAILALGSVAHFVYDWAGRSPWAALFFPVNESIWEHTRLATWPGFLVLAVQRAWLGDDLPRPGLAFAAYGLTAPSLVAVLYYTYTGALGVHSLPADLAVFALAVIAGQAVAFHVGTRGPRRAEPAGWLVAALVAVVSIAWTFRPPHLPLFRDGRDGSYASP